MLFMAILALQFHIRTIPQRQQVLTAAIIGQTITCSESTGLWTLRNDPSACKIKDLLLNYELPADVSNTITSFVKR